MHTIRTAALVLLAAGLLWVSAGQGGQRQNGDMDLEDRVATLERRVAHLERTMAVRDIFAPKSVRQAEQDLEVAVQRLEYCQRVGRKGYITPTRLAACTLEVEKARKQLALARGEAAPEAVEIDVAVLEAEFRVTDTSERLRVSDKMAAAGLATQVQVNAAKLALERAKLDLEAARRRMDQYREGSPEP